MGLPKGHQQEARYIDHSMITAKGPTKFVRCIYAIKGTIYTGIKVNQA